MTLRDLFHQLGDVPVWQAAIFIAIVWAAEKYVSGFVEAWRADRRKRPDLRTYEDLRKES